MTKLEILKKAILDYKDIMAFCEVGQTKAHEIMRVCKTHYSGALKFESKYITCESLMAYLGTSREKELRLLSYENLQNDEI